MNQTQRITLSIGAGIVTALAWSKLKRRERGLSVLKGYPESGAVSAITGGHPEDMNEMPPTNDPESEGPIYDGSQAYDDKEIIETTPR